jgi:hypothetical protein
MPRLILKGQAILERSGEPNAHRLSLRAQVSYPTVDRYINKSDVLTAIDLNILGTLITTGMGLTPEEALAMPLSSLFDMKVDGE